jgi:cystathionine gamma-synthase
VSEESSASRLHPHTQAVVLGRPHAPGDPLNQPLVLSSTYRDGGGLGYAREGNAGWTALEDVVGALEGGLAVSFGSGLAAAVAVLEDLPNGCHVVAPATPYHGITELLAERRRTGRLAVTTLDLRDLGGTADVLAKASAGGRPTALWAESPTNPMLDVVDLAALGRLARDHDAVFIVDNTFATPLLQQPLQWGAAAVVHSATKLLGGHSDLLLGLAVTTDPERAERLLRHRHRNGSVPGSLEAFLALRGIRTLPLRLERAQANAKELAVRLGSHPAVTRVRYPGLSTQPGADIVARQMSGPGSVLAIETVGDAASADHVCAAVRLVVPATSLGGVETLIERRAKYPGDREAGVPDTLLRISVGVEHVDDVWADLDQALNAGLG